MKRLALAVAVLAAAAAASGCGVRRVPDSIIDKLPYEARIELLEAENDLALAVDRVDESKNEVQRTKELIRRGKERLKAANGEVSNASDAVSKEVAELAVVEAEARVEFLRAKQRVNVREEGITEINLTCAMTRFEQSRLLAARKAKLEGSEALDPAEFEAAVKACDAKVAEAKTEMKDTKGEEQTLRASWDASREKLAKKTFDARASPYVE